MRILLVEDNKELGRSLRRLLTEQYAVDHVENAEDALSATVSFAYDLIVLDLSLPDIDGLEVLREIRSRKSTTPVLILTARDKVSDRVSGLDFGADDYMTKPFEVSELEARIRALLRRISMEKTSLLQMGVVKFDLRTNSVSANGDSLDFSARETMVLKSLLLANGNLRSKSQLLDAVTNFDNEVSENAIEQYISRLRRKLSPFGLVIISARGLGYHLSEVS